MVVVPVIVIERHREDHGVAGAGLEEEAVRQGAGENRQAALGREGAGVAGLIDADGVEPAGGGEVQGVL